jgi:drug/metabolite transporter (DMT)-like permease
MKKILSGISAGGNATGILAMIAAMAFFVANDTCVKLVGETLPLGELITLRNTFATGYILLFALAFGGLTMPPHPPTKILSWRLAGEFLSTTFFLSGLVALPIADATAIGQLTPIAITAGAAIFMKEPVGWRRWLAAVVGLIGVLFIIRPGTAAFQPAALLILAAVAFVVLRDLATRAVSTSVPTLTLTAMSAFVSIFAGLVMWPFETWIIPDFKQVWLLMLAAFFLTIAYALTIVAMRNGEVAVVSPFRYAIIIFAILSGWFFWKQWPDNIQMFGIAVLTAAGLYTFHRERLRQSSR